MHSMQLVHRSKSMTRIPAPRSRLIDLHELASDDRERKRTVACWSKSSRIRINLEVAIRALSFGLEIQTVDFS